jgi:hypothetical protein
VQAQAQYNFCADGRQPFFDRLLVWRINSGMEYARVRSGFMAEQDSRSTKSDDQPRHMIRPDAGRLLGAVALALAGIASGATETPADFYRGKDVEGIIHGIESADQGTVDALRQAIAR